LYRDPHQIIEALVVCGYIQQADMAYVFVRGEYAEGARLLERAVKEARAAGYLGKNILGSGYDLEIDVHLSAGRYICGEETSLLNALEGRRGNPRHKPPFPAVSGLWGKPTLVNNLETFCQVPGMVKNGLDWYKSLGVNGGAGTKLYSICGPVKKPGFFELPMGTTAREIIYEQGGGLLEDRQLVGFLPGGASTQFMLPEHLDTPMHFEGPPKVGSRLGTGGFIILDSATCPIAFLINIMHFFARESCGFCTPCRDGLPFVKYLLEKIKQGKGEMSDLDLLDELCEKIYPSTFCAFAPGALMPVMSGLSHFRDVFEQRIRDKGAH
jgi:NADH-quinone oxidoreductase subunit F